MNSMEFLFPPPRRGRPAFPVLLDANERVVELVSHYLASLAQSARGYSLATIDQYGKQLTYFCEFVAADDRYSRMQMDHVLASIPGGVIDQYHAWSRQHGREDSTIRNRDVILKGFFEWLTTSEAGKVRDSSGYEAGLKSAGGKRKMPRFVTKELVVSLLNGLHHESQRCLIHFVYDAGLRVSEVPRVTQADIEALGHWPDHLPYLPLLIRGSKGRGGRNIKERYSLISRAVYSRIRRYHNTPSYRFARCDGPKPAFLNTHRKPITARGIQKLVADASRRIGLPPRTISPHRLRHGTALTILQGEAGQDYLEKLVLIQMQFGHSSIRATEAYTHIPPSLFTQVQSSKELRTRFEEAQDIYDRTYLPLNKHKERRGRKRR